MLKGWLYAAIAIGKNLTIYCISVSEYVDIYQLFHFIMDRGATFLLVRRKTWFLHHSPTHPPTTTPPDDSLNKMFCMPVWHQCFLLISLSLVV